MLTDSVDSLFNENSFSITGQNILVAVSGGIDSMSMLHFFVTNIEHYGIKNIYAAHFNHNLRGEESFIDQKTVEEFTDIMNVELFKGFGQMSGRKKPKGESIESWARTLRYEFLHDISKRKNTYIFTAHTLNDSSETVLFNLVRGTGLKGAGGIPFSNDSIIRPFLKISEKQIEEYAKEFDIPYRYDSSNSNNEFSRNRIRNRIIPELNTINPKSSENIQRFASYAKDADLYFTEIAERIINESKISGGIDGEKLKTNPKIVLGYIMRALYSGNTCINEPNERLIEEMISVLNGEKNAIQLDTDRIMSNTDGIISIKQRVQENKPFKIPASSGRNILPDGSVVLLERYDILNGSEINENYNSFDLLDYDKVRGFIHLRSREHGDLFHSAKRNLTKSLKKLFNERKISKELRLTVPVMSDEQGIIWLPSEGVSRRVSPDENTRTILKISYIKEE